jgi:molybdate transport system permease protein
MSEWTLFFKVTFPNSIPSIVAGTILAFARALGEFARRLCSRATFPAKRRPCPWPSIPPFRPELDLAYRWTAIIICISFFSITLMNWWTKRIARFEKGL